MYSAGEDDGAEVKPVRTSDRIRQRPKSFVRHGRFRSPSFTPAKRSNYAQAKRRKQKNQFRKRTAASQIAKNLVNKRNTVESSNANDSVAANLRRSNRKRRTSWNLEEYIDNSSGTEDNDLMGPKYRNSRSRTNNGARKDVRSPRRAGLRPRRSKVSTLDELIIGSDDEQDSSEDDVDRMGAENGNDIEENGSENDEGEDEGGGEGDGEDEGEGEDDGDDDDDDDDGEEEQEGRRRYDLRNRADVRRLSLEGGNKQRPRSPRRILQQGVGTKLGREVRRGGSRVHKRHRFSRAEDSDDSLLVDELDQGPPIPWGRGGNRSGPPWLFGGLDIHGTSAWGLNAAASGWGPQGDSLNNLSAGVQTAGPSSKGGADIQPLQIDESVSFDEIGGLSDHIDALKEMVFFPLLYPDFFASYHITPPRGVLLCGPPGTGKTLIARALASAASKAGQKVSFYMRKGADVLSKWVGEAERQLKLLFEEAQKNQPSIIFFDEIDGLAPVRSSKQEQIHNSIVSTLLALMDGLDSRGQVVLIGATNRIDAIDGALRRPGRFDREFTFQLPGCDARAEILDIHTRKWKQPPSKELRLELAASCVGYCGADLKALCTEAAIRAFREKYPQVYTSDDKFLIDVDSVNVEKYHFMEAMSTITPAAHRGSLVPSRPLSPVVAPCLQRYLKKALSIISNIFPVEVSPEMAKFSMFAYGSAIPRVYRPRLLICGEDGSGLDHLGPAVLHELEKFPVHSLGLSSLLSDPAAKTPEEALVHIFGEARRTTPSILFLPQFDLWWENAHHQLKAVLLTLLAELPSHATILLLGTSLILTPQADDNYSSVFRSRNVYHMDKPSIEDRSTFFDNLLLSALSIPSDGVATKSSVPVSLPELPKAPKIATGPKASELKAQAEAESHALRRLRMCLRDICNRSFSILPPSQNEFSIALDQEQFWTNILGQRILYDKRFNAFHFPVMDEDAPNYRTIIQNPMDMATLLQHVDCGKYITCKAFLDDFDLILANAKKYNGDDYNGARIVSRACELRDTVHGMLSQMDPALVAFCEKIAAEGGPVSVPDELGGFSFQNTPVVQMTAVTRTSARLRNVQPEVNLDQSYEALKRAKTTNDIAHAEDVPQSQEPVLPSKSSQETEVVDPNPTVDISPDDHTVQVEVETMNDVSELKSQDVEMSDAESSSKCNSIKQLFVERTGDYGIPKLERLYASIMKAVFEVKKTERSDNLKSSILSFLLKFAEDEANF